MPDAGPRPWETEYQITDTTVIAETPDLRVLEITLGPGEEVPWHVHSMVEDIFYCLSGALEIFTRKPEASHPVAPGRSCRIPHGRAERGHHALRPRPGPRPLRLCAVDLNGRAPAPEFSRC